MAARSFLKTEKMEAAKAFFSTLPANSESSILFSKYLQAELKLELPRGWEELRPILLGSWARGELSPRSDLDVLFLADEEKVQSFTREAQSRGIRLGFRVPQNSDDWTEGVELSDCFALFDAVALNPEDAQIVEEQKLRIRQNSKLKQKMALFAKTENESRRLRYDGYSQVLEPNLKYGAGGLRDILQARILIQLFQEKMVDVNENLARLEESKRLFASISM